MELIKAPRRRVFDFVTDPRNFSSGLPGVKAVRVTGPDRFDVTARLGVAAVGAVFKIAFVVSDNKSPEHARLSGHGMGSAGAIDLVIVVDLREARGGGTELSWGVDAKVSGMLASLGGRVLNPVADTLAKGIFQRIRENLERAGGEHLPS